MLKYGRHEKRKEKKNRKKERKKQADERGDNIFYMHQILFAAAGRADV